MKAIEAVNVLESEFNENINSHIFLLETNNLDECLKDIKRICGKIINTKDDIINKQLEEETYLELIIIRPDGKEIKKDQILTLQERLKTKPILSNKLIYIILLAEAMNATSANKLLKTIEEPNDHAVGFLISKNIDLILPTIKSRCEILSIMYDKKINYDIDKETLEIATELVDAIETKNHIKFTKIKLNDKILKENSQSIENLIKDYYNTACNLSKNDKLDQKLIEKIRANNSYNLLIAKTKYLNKTINKLTTKMNTDLLLEKLFIELKDVK